MSIVIPTRDDEAELDRCLRALARQTDPADEVIVVDNASSDGTAAVATRWGARCIAEHEVGIPAAASTGYDAALSQVIARLDADSVPPSDWVERIRRAFDEQPGLAAITGPGDFPDLSPRRRALADRLYMRSYFRLFGSLIGHPPLFGSNFAMTHATWWQARDGIHRHDPAVHDDLDLSFHMPRGALVTLDDDLRVEISARPFDSARAMIVRIWRGIRTYALNVGAIRSQRAYVRGSRKGREDRAPAS